MLVTAEHLIGGGVGCGVGCHYTGCKHLSLIQTNYCRHVISACY